MAFLSTPEVEWLYSGVTKTKPSNAAILSAHALVCVVRVLARCDGGIGLVQVGQRVVGQVDELVLARRCAAGGLGDHPLGDGLAVAAGAGAAEDDGDIEISHGTLFGIEC